MNKCNWCHKPTELKGTECNQRVVYKQKTYVYRRFFVACRDCNRAKARKYYATPKGKANIRAVIARAERRHPERQQARTKLNNAIKKGVVFKPKNCSNCKAAASKIEGHHVDYSKPLKVVWLCSACHYQADQRGKKM